MKKMNKKGFTLIEMLVVIAIIAVLVAIIIPTVTSSTDKAAAAANAANLRSVKAEITTAILTGTIADPTAADAFDSYISGVSMKPVATTETSDDVITVTYNSDKSVTVEYEGLNIAEWAARAGGAAATTPTTT